MQAVVQLVVKL